MSTAINFSKCPIQISDMPMIKDIFDLDRCLDEVHSDSTVIESWSCLPEPQKFPTPSSKDQVAVSHCTSTKLELNYKATSHKALGIMIAREEAANWSCSDEEIRNSACTAADLMMVHDLR
jgi:hypothetical protein